MAAILSKTGQVWIKQGSFGAKWASKREMAAILSKTGQVWIKQGSFGAKWQVKWKWQPF